MGDRHVERHHLVAERRLGLREHAGVVGARVVELADHDAARHTDALALVPQSAGRAVDALAGGDHEQRAVGGAKAGAQLADEVGIAGSVEQVDLDVAATMIGARLSPTDRCCRISDSS